MNKREMEELLTQVAAGTKSVDEAILAIKREPFEQAMETMAKPDFHRQIRQGEGEVIYGASKTPEQISQIAKSLYEGGQKTILITRMTKFAAENMDESLPFTYFAEGKIGLVGQMKKPRVKGNILIVTGGTSDIPVAEEAALTAEILGNNVERLYDVGVSGLHRLLSNLDSIMTARVIISIAGMEGALASVIGGLADCPVIAVPTSVGYGVSLGGVTALLAMLNSCASGVSVVNIDNGFGAGYLANLINNMEGTK